MKRWGRLLLVLTTGFTAACTTDQVLAVIQPAQSVLHGQARGKILDQTTQKPLPQAQVTIGSQVVTVDADGYYVARELNGGTLFLQVRADGYQPFFGELEIGAGETRFDVPLQPLPGSDASAGPSPSPASAPSPSSEPAKP